MSIGQLNQGTPALDSQIPFRDSTNGVDRKCSAAQLRDLLLADNASAAGWKTQYAAPSASGFVIPITPDFDGQSVWLLLMPTAGFAAGTLTLPDITTLADRQEFECLYSQNLAALTVNGSGASVNGAPTALTANDMFKLRFDAGTSTWYPAL